MQYDVNSPSAYIDALEDDWRKEMLLKIRATILSGASEIAEGIEYKMLRYGDDRQSLFHLNAQKNYVSLYVGDARKIDETGELLKGLDLGKGCIRFKKTTNVEESRIAEFIIKAIDLWRSGSDLSC
ncbi:MAG: DUF1801 domain-containing protein [Cyclobacteriaceae bacterium]